MIVNHVVVCVSIDTDSLHDKFINRHNLTDIILCFLEAEPVIDTSICLLLSTVAELFDESGLSEAR